MIYKKYFYSTLFLALLALTLQAQNPTPFKRCATMESWESMAKKNPEILENQRKIEAATQQIIKNNEKRNPKDLQSAVITIPVVFHVVYTSSKPETNISDAQLASQLKILNEDYRRQNEDASETLSDFSNIVADSEIEFCLASTDPNGNATTGIIRTSTTKTSFDADENDIKFANSGGQDAWPANKYLNIWICNKICCIDGQSTILGYAQFPGGSPETDGVVLAHYVVGNTGTATYPYDKGRTATHEVGHWLNLRHIWGDDPDCFYDDAVSDTPKAADAHYQCWLDDNTCTDSPVDMLDMVQNYMDYTEDACLNAFTKGQKNRMRALFDPGQARASLLNSTACSTTSTANDVALVSIDDPLGSNNCTTVEPLITIKNVGSNNLTYVEFKYRIDNATDKLVYWEADNNYPALTPGQQWQLYLPAVYPPNTNANHTIYITLIKPNNTTDSDNTDNSLQQNFATIGTGVTAPYQQTFQGNSFPPAGWAVNSQDASKEFVQNTNTGYNSSKCVYINNYNYNAINTADEIVMPDLNLSTQDAPTLTFYTAYALTSNNDVSDVLSVYVSADCGYNYDKIYEKSGSGLTSASPTSSNFVPSSDSEWKLHSINLNEYAKVQNLIVVFRQDKGEGNNLYIDNVNINGFPIGINNTSIPPNSIQIYPNPAQKFLQIQINQSNTTNIWKINEPINFVLYNSIGQIILTQSHKYTPNQTFDIQLPPTLPAHMYFLSIEHAGKKMVEKVMIMNK